ncbi:MAG: hypothetical protein NC191_06750, partial [Muribaculaceae bacterium]|nr:hypothetical protein [Muribaculaceae bacterium]
MKKIVLLLVGLLLGNSAVFAHCDYKCVAPYDMNSKFKTFASAASGVNSITELKLESLIRKEILKYVSARNLKVDFNTYSPKDIRNGIFKSMKITGEEVLINDIHLSSIDLETLCDFNYVKQVEKDIVFVEDLPMSFKLSISQDDINKTMQHPTYQKLIDDLNLVVGSFVKGVKISSTRVALKNRKFYYIIGFSIPFVRSEQKIVLQADVCVRNGKIDLLNAKVVSGSFDLDLKRADFLLSRLNPLDFSVKILKNKKAKISVQNISLSGDGSAIVADG